MCRGATGPDGGAALFSSSARATRAAAARTAIFRIEDSRDSGPQVWQILHRRKQSMNIMIIMINIIHKHEGNDHGAASPSRKSSERVIPTPEFRSERSQSGR